MFFKQQIVQLEQIDNDQTFRISTDSDISRLVASMQRFGLINFPIVANRNDRYQIICGFARIGAARALGWNEVPVRVVPVEQSFEKKCLLAIVDNTAHRTLNVVEQSRAIALLSQIVTRPTELIELARNAGISINKDLLTKLQKINRMPSLFHIGLIDGRIALPVALRLLKMIDSTQGILTEGILDLAEMLLELNLSLNRQRELIDWIEAIVHRDGMSISELLNEETIRYWRQELPGDRANRAQKIREYFRTRRYPQISAAQDRFNQTLKKLHLPPGMRLVAPPFFESPTFSLHMDFQNRNDLSRLENELNRIAKSPLLDDLMDPEK